MECGHCVAIKHLSDPLVGLTSCTRTVLNRPIIRHHFTATIIPADTAGLEGSIEPIMPARPPEEPADLWLRVIVPFTWHQADRPCCI